MSFRAGYLGFLPSLAGLLLGCQAIGFPGMSAGGGKAREEIFGFSRESRPIRGTILDFGRRETLLLFGVIHGNEPLGRPLLERLVEHVKAHPSAAARKRLVVVPVANPDGLARRSRRNTRGVDLNRNFPARNWRSSRSNGPFPGSEPETRALIKIIRQFQPSRILAVHSPLRVVNYDGPAEPLAREMAHACGYGVAGSVDYPTPGSLGGYAGRDWDTPTITLELGPEITGANVWPRFRRALEVFILFPDLTVVAAP